MTAFGYVLRNVLFLVWHDEHEPFAVDQCRRRYRLGLLRWSVRLCASSWRIGGKLGKLGHETRYFGPRYIALISLLRALLVCAIAACVTGWCAARTVDAALGDIRTPAPRWIVRR